MPEVKRRSFLKQTLRGLSLLTIGSLITQVIDAGKSTAASAAKKLPLVNPKTDPMAKTLDYVEKGSDVDKKKYPKFKMDQKCSNCQLYTDKKAIAKDAWGPCVIFPGKSVAAEGWCKSWVINQKPK